MADDITTTEDMQKEFEAILEELSKGADDLQKRRAAKGRHALNSLVDLQTLVKFRDLATTVRSLDPAAIGQ